MHRGYIGGRHRERERERQRERERKGDRGREGRERERHAQTGREGERLKLRDAYTPGLINVSAAFDHCMGGTRIDRNPATTPEGVIDLGYRAYGASCTGSGSNPKPKTPDPTWGFMARYKQCFEMTRTTFY